MNTSPLQLAALRAGSLHTSNSEQGHNPPAFSGCPSALSAWHTELSLNDRANVTQKSLSGGGLRCSFYCVRDCPLSADPFTGISNNSQQLREDLDSHTQVFTKH